MEDREVPLLKIGNRRLNLSCVKAHYNHKRTSSPCVVVLSSHLVAPICSDAAFLLTRGGNVNMTTGSLRNAGNNGNYWASTAYPSELYAYNLNFNSTNVNPSNNNNRWNGFTVRCLAGFPVRSSIFPNLKPSLFSYHLKHFLDYPKNLSYSTRYFPKLYTS